MNKHLIFIFRRPNAKDKKLCSCDNSIIIPLDNYARFSLEENNLNYFTLNDYFDKKDYLASIAELSDLVEKCGNYPLSGGTPVTLKESLIYEDISLWDLCRQHLSDELFNNLFFFKTIKRIIDLEKPETISILGGGHSEKEAIIKVVAKKIGVSFIFYPADIFSRANSFYNQAFNYFLSRPHPFIDLLNNAPNSFIIVEKLQKLKERIISLKQKNKARAPVLAECEKKKILVLSFANYHSFIRSTSNIISEFNKSDTALLVRADVLSRDFKQFCRRLRAPFISYYTYLSGDLDSKIKIVYNRLFKKVKAIKLRSFLSPAEDVLGPGFNNSFKRFRSAYLSRYGLLRLVRFKLIVESVLNRENPDLMIIQEDLTRFGRIAVLEARKKQIPCLVILQHISEYDAFWNLFLRIPSLADAVAVTTDKVKDLLIKNGMDERKIVITGNLYYDRVLKKRFDLLSREHIYSKLEINIKKDILLFTSQPLPQSDLLHRALIKAMESFPDKHLVIKMHPLEPGIRSFLKVKGSKLRNVSLVKDIDTWSLINSSKLLITISSITAVEAMMLKKPVVLFGLNPEPVLAPLIEAEAVFPVNRFRDLPLAVEKILTDDSLKEKLIGRADKFIQENLGPHEGQVDKRTKDLINSLISR